MNGPIDSLQIRPDRTGPAAVYWGGILCHLNHSKVMSSGPSSVCGLAPSHEEVKGLSLISLSPKRGLFPTHGAFALFGLSIIGVLLSSSFPSPTLFKTPSPVNTTRRHVYRRARLLLRRPHPGR